MAVRRAFCCDWNKVEDGMVLGDFVDFTTDHKRTGSHSINLGGWWNDFSDIFDVHFPEELSEFYYQFAWYLSSITDGTRPIIAWRNKATGATLGGLKYNHNTRVLDLYTGDFSTLVASGTKALDPGNWYVIEVRVKIADTDGVIETRVDMIADASFSGDTKPGSETGVDLIRHGNSNHDTYVDDIVLNDTSGTENNSWPGGVKCYLLRPNGDGTTLDWTPTPSGSHYTTVDDSEPDSSDYLQTNAVDKVDELALEDLPAEAQVVRAVVVHFWGQKGSEEAPSRVAVGLKIGGADYYSDDLDLPTSMQDVSHVFDTNPAGGNWTPDTVNNMNLLIKSRT